MLYIWRVNNFSVGPLLVPEIPPSAAKSENDKSPFFRQALLPAGACCHWPDKKFIIISSYGLQSQTNGFFVGPPQVPKPKNDGQKSYQYLKKIINSSKKFIYQKYFLITRKWIWPELSSEFYLPKKWVLEESTV